jgi:hypothetical protein
MGGTPGVEEGSEVYEFIYDSGRTCARCDEKIMLLDEVYLLQVVVARMNGEFSIQPAESDEGDYLFEPILFCFSCWEENCEDLISLDEGQATIYDERGVFDCTVCDSSILTDEYFGQPLIGEIRCSERMPSGEVSHYFHYLEGNKEPPCICISCLKRINDEVVEMWDDVDQEGECDVGTHLRCWRTSCLDQCDLTGFE